MSAESEIFYPEDFMAKLQVTWGQGFLSPGGPEEVAKIVEGLDLSGRTVLDFGCGLVGPSCLLAEEHGAGKVVGIDIERPAHEAARATVESRGLADRIELHLVEPGPLIFEDGSFDVIFSKDSIIHVPDKAALYAEFLRVLKPGGWMTVSDWFRGTQPFSKEMEEWLELMHLEFVMVPIEEAAKVLEQAGFTEVGYLDRNPWYARRCREDTEMTAGPLRDSLVAAVGEEEADWWIDRNKARCTVAEQGHLRPGHLRGRKS